MNIFCYIHLPLIRTHEPVLGTNQNTTVSWNPLVQSSNAAQKASPPASLFLDEFSPALRWLRVSRKAARPLRDAASSRASQAGLRRSPPLSRVVGRIKVLNRAPTHVLNK